MMREQLRGHQEAIKRPSRGHQEAIKLQKRTRTDATALRRRLELPEATPEVGRRAIIRDGVHELLVLWVDE